jgi:hypothetical protein
MPVANSLVDRAYLRRGAVLWLLARALLSVVLAFADASPLALSSQASVITIVVVTTLGFAQTMRLRESVLLGNLGVSRPMLAAFFALPALIGELAIAAIGAAVT